MKFIEVCSGCGGLSQGFFDAGFQPLLLNEIDKVCVSTLHLNHPDVHIDCGDMNKLDLTPYKGQVEVLIGGVPCQSFSQSGLRKGLDDKRGDLILKFKQLVDQCEPKVFLIENVKGLLTHDKGITIAKVIKHLNSSGIYDITYKLLNAVNYGVPQKRERVFIVGVRKDLERQFVFPEPLPEKVLLRDVLVDCPPSEGFQYPESKQKVMELVPQGGCWVDLPKDVQKTYMGASLEAGGGKRGMARRLSLNEPCLTLTTSPCQKQTERCHPLETRPLNVREYARIQTFPDTYMFHGTVAQKYKQIGNAVPVKLAFCIASSVKALLD